MKKDTQMVFITANVKRQGPQKKRFHVMRECSHLNHAKNVQAISLEQAEQLDCTPCACKKQSSVSDCLPAIEIDWDRCITVPIEPTANPWKPAGYDIVGGVYADDRVTREPICDIFGRTIEQGENMFDETAMLDEIWHLSTPTWDEEEEEVRANDCAEEEELDRFCDNERWAYYGNVNDHAFFVSAQHDDDVTTKGEKRSTQSFRLLNSDWGQKFFRSGRRHEKPPEQKPLYKTRNRGKVPMGVMALILDQIASGNGNGQAPETGKTRVIELNMPIACPKMDMAAIEMSGTSGKAHACLTMR